MCTGATEMPIPDAIEAQQTLQGEGWRATVTERVSDLAHSVSQYVEKEIGGGLQV